MAYLQLDLDALNLCPVLGPAMGLDGPRALWGLSQLWAWAFRHQAETVPDELVCGFFAGANDPAAKLIAFGFLARESSGVCRIKGAAGRLLLTRRAQSEAGKRNAKNLNGRRATCKGAGGEPELEPEVSRETPDGSTPALTPSTKHQTPKEDLEALSAAPTGGAPDAPSAPDSPLPVSEEPPPKTPLSAQVREVFDFWRETLGHTTSKLDGKREHAITARLKAGFSVDDLRQAILGCSLTPHNMGQNDKGQRYDDIELICRNASNTERFMANATNPPIPKARAPPGRPANPDLIVGRSTAPPPPPRPPEPDFGF